MCGRYYIADEEEIIEMREIINEVNQRYHNSQMKTGEIFPTNVAPILVADDQGIKADLMTWGYPKWQGSGVVINARSETAAEKPMFRGSISSKRCIVPSTGFYEWDHAGGRTGDKYLLRPKVKEILYMAGLYNQYKDNQGMAYWAFVILTTDANVTVKNIHDRMPLIVDAGQRDLWLHDESFARIFLQLPCVAELMMIKA